jgi:putative hemolysin
MAIEDLELALGVSDIDADDAPYTTVAGLVIHFLQRLPQLGDVVVSNGWRYEVIDMDSRRIDKLLVSRLPSRDEDPTG